MDSAAVAPAWELACAACQRRWRHAGTGNPVPGYRCPECNHPLEVAFPAPAGSAKDWPALWRERKLSAQAGDQSGVWRFREMLPPLPPAAAIVTLREGNTPLYDLPRTAARLGLARLLAKHQGMNPTGSFKDTGMTVALTVARHLGYHWVACASTGNTSASMAAYAARAGLRSLVLLPAGKIAVPKLAQALDYGALTCQLDTDFDGCLRLVGELMERRPIYLVNSVNPFRVQGQKTAAIELMEQLGWQPPDHLVVPGGNLGNGSALGLGLFELADAGLIPRPPKISIIQAEGANPLARSWRLDRGARLQPMTAETLATAIRIGAPASWRRAVAVLRRSGGECIDVTESAIANAKAEIGAEGIGCEPASAATLAGVQKLAAAGWIRPGETVVLVLTGHTLKDGDYTVAYHEGRLPGVEATRRRPPVALPASAAAVAAALEAEERRP